MNENPDWALWRSFAGVAEHGSLSGAARAIGVSQPTLGRHIETLEAALGARLFERSVSGLKPTELGLRAYEPVRKAADALAEARLLAAGAGGGVLEGSVRITASLVTAHYTLPRMLARLREEFPMIALELVPSDSVENLLMREADIAVRMFRPTQLDLITKKLGQSPVVACAHRDYLDRRGRPKAPQELIAHDLIGFDRSDLLISAARGMGFPLERKDFAFRCDNQSAFWELLKAGCGIGFAQENIIRETPGMEIIGLELPIPPLEVWLTTHRELHASRRIRAVYDRLGEMMGDWLDGKMVSQAGADAL